VNANDAADSYMCIEVGKRNHCACAVHACWQQALQLTSILMRQRQEVQPLHPPKADFLRSLYALPKGEGHSDFMEALAVAADIMIQAINSHPGGTCSTPLPAPCLTHFWGVWQAA
jgi:hypothetical protein